MNTEEQQRKNTLDHMIDEKFGELFFLAKDEFDIANNTQEEQRLYDFLDNFKINVKKRIGSPRVGNFFRSNLKIIRIIIHTLFFKKL